MALDERRIDRTDARRLPVVVGYLEGPTGDAALASAAEEARLRGTTLTVMHELIGDEAPDRYGPDAGSSLPQAAAMMRLLTKAQDAAPGLAHIDVRTVTHGIAEELIAASASAQLIVLGVSTHHVSTAALFDTVPRTVAARAHCPVMLLGADARPVSSIVCGIDRSPASVAALRWAAEDAARRGTTVLAVEVLPANAVDDARSEDDLDCWVRGYVPPTETTVMCATHHGKPAKALASLAKDQRALLVIGSREHHAHSVARVVTAEAQVPVVVVPTAGPEARASSTAKSRHRLGSVSA